VYAPTYRRATAADAAAIAHVSLREQLRDTEGFAWDETTLPALIMRLSCRVGYQVDRWSVVVVFMVYTLCIILIFVCNWALARDPLPATNVST